MPRSKKSPTCSGNDVLRVLLVGFGPFPGAPFNPSAALAEALARRRRPALASTQRTVHIFATSYAAVDRDLPRLFAENPDIVLMFGLAGRRRAPLHRDPRAQRAIGFISRRQRISATARRHFAGRTRRHPRQRAFRRSARRTARSFLPCPAVARRRAISLQLRLLAMFAARRRSPAAGAICSYSAGQVRRPTQTAAQSIRFGPCWRRPRPF